MNPSARNFYGAAPWFSSSQQLMVFYGQFSLDGDTVSAQKGWISRFYINTSDWSHGIDNEATIEAITGLLPGRTQ